MRKSIFYMALMLLTSAVTLTSCDNDSSAGKTSITYYPVLSLNGSEEMSVDKGTSFSDPGCAAELNGEDVSSKVVTSGSVDTNQSGVYTVTYTVTNADGFSASKSRTVVVTDPNDPREGIFYSDASSYRDYSGQKAFGSSFKVIITASETGQSYHVTDFFGGWYSQRAGYGSKYNMEGNMSVAADGSLSLVYSSIAGWGDSLNDLTGTFDVATGTYTWDAYYYDSAMVFHVILCK